MKKLITLIAVLSLAACSQTPQIKADAEVLDSGLVKVSHTRFDNVYVAPNTDFRQISSYVVKPLDTSGLDVTLQRNRGIETDWDLTEQDRDYFARIYSEAMTDKLQNDGGYTLINQPSSNSAVIVGKLVEIVPYNDKRTSINRSTRSKSYGSSPGIMEIEYQVFDAHGQLIAQMQDRREAGNRMGVQQQTTVSASNDVKRLFRLWADMVKTGIEHAQAQ